MGLVKVKAVVKVRDNGRNHAPGEEFEMEAGLAEVHERAGQVVRQSTSPRDKQSLGASDK